MHRQSHVPLCPLDSFIGMYVCIAEDVLVIADNVKCKSDYIEVIVTVIC